MTACEALNRDAFFITASILVGFLKMVWCLNIVGEKKTTTQQNRWSWLVCHFKGLENSKYRVGAVHHLSGKLYFNGPSAPIGVL